MKSYSQNGEDKMYVPLLPARGTLLEIGAFHPTELSNSRALIEAGWNAVLVEANPLSLQHLLNFYRVTEPNERVSIVSALVTPDAVSSITPFKLCWDAVSTVQEAHYKLWKNTVSYFDSHMASTPLKTLLDAFAGPYDFVSIDVEGISGALLTQLFALGVLPQVVCVEHSPEDRVRLRRLSEIHGYGTILENDENFVFKKGNPCM